MVSRLGCHMSCCCIRRQNDSDFHCFGQSMQMQRLPLTLHVMFCSIWEKHNEQAWHMLNFHPIDVKAFINEDAYPWVLQVDGPWIAGCYLQPASINRSLMLKNLLLIMHNVWTLPGMSDLVLSSAATRVWLMHRQTRPRELLRTRIIMSCVHITVRLVRKHTFCVFR